ncbi:hypothetical protein L6R52_25835 [Myxococcota bacterium]|nr:hypothetical protein [Myxococcota bacterium]
MTKLQRPPDPNVALQLLAERIVRDPTHGVFQQLPDPEHGDLGGWWLCHSCGAQNENEADDITHDADCLFKQATSALDGIPRLELIEPDEVEVIIGALRLLKRCDPLSTLRDAETRPCPVTLATGDVRRRRALDALRELAVRAAVFEAEMVERYHGESDRHVGRACERRARAVRRALGLAANADVLTGATS